MASETFVDITWRGLEVGRRVKLRSIRAASAYVEHSTPMPVGTRLRFKTAEGIDLSATVMRVHEQVSGANEPPGMLVAPAPDGATAAWWAERAEPEAAPAPTGSAPPAAGSLAAIVPGAAPSMSPWPEPPPMAPDTPPMAPETHTQPMAPETHTQPMAPETDTQPMAPETDTQPMAPETDTQPMAPIDELAAASPARSALVDDEPSTPTIRPSTSPELAETSVEDVGSTQVMAAISDDDLAAMERGEIPGALRVSDADEGAADEGGRTMVMSAVDVSAMAELGGDADGDDGGGEDPPGTELPNAELPSESGDAAARGKRRGRSKRKKR